MKAKEKFTREAVIAAETREAGETTEVVVRCSVSSETPYPRMMKDPESGERVECLEVLGHKDSEIDFSRMKSGLVIQDTHYGDQVGIIRAPELTDGKLGGVIEFCCDERAQCIKKDAERGIRTNMSVGYLVKKYERAGVDEETGLPIFRVTKWMPYEASFVNVPADTQVGVGREADITEEKPAETTATKEDSNMETIEKPVAVGVTAEEVRGIVADEIKGLREEITKKPEMPEAKRVAAFDEAEQRQVAKEYNLLNAIRALAGEKVDIGFERECSQQIASATHKSARGLFIPESALARVYTGKTNVSDHIVGNGAALVPTEIMFDKFIDALVAQTKFGELGVQVMSGLVGDIALPKAAAMSAGWVTAEDAAAPNKNPTFSQVTGTPHTIAANTILSRKLMLQTSGSVQGIVGRLITEAIARGIETAGFCGDGTSGAPTGLGSVSGTNSVSMTAGSPTFANLVDFWKEVAIDNANLANCKFVMGPAAKALLAKTVEVITVENKAKSENVGGVRGNKLIGDDGKIQGYDVVTSGLCDQTKIYFGDFSEMILGFWSGLDLTVDPYTYSANGAVQLTAFQDCDVLVRNPSAFAIGTALSA